MATLVVPCAGLGSRLGSKEPKALVRFGELSILSTILMRINHSFDKIILVVRPVDHALFVSELNKELDTKVIAKLNFRFQQEPSGSLDAVFIGINDLWDDIVVVWGDQIGVSPFTVQEVINSLKIFEFVLPIIEINQPYVWFNIFQNRIIGVERSRDGDPIPVSGLSDVGVFGFSNQALNSLKTIIFDTFQVNSLRERDLLYIFPEATNHLTTRYIEVTDLKENLAINNPEQLKSALEIFGR